MRRRIYVLYEDRVGTFFVHIDKYTPLRELLMLDHCYGVYPSAMDAVRKADTYLRQRAKTARDNQRALHKKWGTK